MTIRRPATILAAALLLLTAGCGAQTPGTGTATAAPSSATSTSAPTGRLTVLAAASLTESFTELGRRFEAAHPGSTVTFSFGSSATLATQINSGAPADVFAAASATTMSTVTDAGNAGTPTTFATNTLEIAVPEGNPAKITGLADFADPDRTIALCAEQVPCGAAAVKVFRLAGITPKPDTLESDVKATLQKVELGEVDAALVYRTDVIAAGDRVEGIEVPQAAEVVNSYPIATLRASRSAQLADEFVRYVLSTDGQTVLTRAGFGKP